MPERIKNVELSEFYYELPEDRIAQFPLEKRDDAKLLVYDKGEIAHSHFFKLHHFLNKESLLVFNNTHVIPARLIFQKASGSFIEVFLMQPVEPKWISASMQAVGQCVWKCLIGNKKRWKNNEILFQEIPGEAEPLLLQAQLIDPEQQHVRFSWADKHWRMVDILRLFGRIPLPPYLKRAVETQDTYQYQTVYSALEGAVAAPTAGLHFTKDVLAKLEKKGVAQDFITLHVGGGTFQPIKTQTISEHPMHSEQIIFSRQNIKNLLVNGRRITAVGTTSLRAIESLYWYGVKLLHSENHRDKPLPFVIEKLCPYHHPQHTHPSREEALHAVLLTMRKYRLTELIGETEIFIFPGYPFKMTDNLITNFHLPNTTLILLVAAFIGQDWRKVYQEALDQNYRF